MDLEGLQTLIDTRTTHGLECAVSTCEEPLDAGNLAGLSPAHMKEPAIFLLGRRCLKVADQGGIQTCSVDVILEYFKNIEATRVVILGELRVLMVEEKS